MGNIDLTSSLAVFGKIGVFVWDAEGDVKETESGQLAKFDDNGTDLLYGLGVRFEINPQLDVRAEWERYNADRNDMNFYSIGLEYHF